MDYLSYFNLTAEPFSHAPVPQFYYASEQHTKALDRMMHVAATSKGLALLLGDIGHGKTTLARRMLDALPEAHYEAALLIIVHTNITANWLLKRIALQLGVDKPAEDKLTILSQLYGRLVQIHQQGKRAVVLIDEAQMLQTRELMEEFRGLLNLEVPGHKLISFIFFGLPELDNYLALDPPLLQRVALRYRLRPLSLEDTMSYVNHRLKLAGGGELFDPQALEEVHQWSRGVPRVINTLCDNILLELFMERGRRVTPELVASVAESLGLLVAIQPPPPRAEPEDIPAVDGGLGHDAIVAVSRQALEPDAIAARVAGESVESDAAPVELAPPEVPPPFAPSFALTSHSLPVPAEAQPPVQSSDIEDPLAFLGAAVEREPAAAEASLADTAADAFDVELDLGDTAPTPVIPEPMFASPAAESRAPSNLAEVEIDFNEADTAEMMVPHLPPASAPPAPEVPTASPVQEVVAPAAPAAPSPTPRAVVPKAPPSPPSPPAMPAAAKPAKPSTLDLQAIDDLLNEVSRIK